MSAKTLPADPEKMNHKRASWAQAAITAFVARTGTDCEDAISDMLCDLMHFCDRYEGEGSDGGWEGFEDALERARRSYQEETQS